MNQIAHKTEPFIFTVRMLLKKLHLKLITKYEFHIYSCGFLNMKKRSNLFENTHFLLENTIL